MDAQVGFVYDRDNSIIEYQIGFCGFFPTEHPRYSIIVSMNKLGLPASGSGMAGAVFHDIVEWMCNHGKPPVIFVDEKPNDTIRVAENTIDKN